MSNAHKESTQQDEFDVCLDRVIREYFDSEVGPRTPAAGAGSVADGQSELEPTFVPPRCVGRHVVSSVIGRGGLGIVLRAMDPELGREVAIKIIRPRHRGNHDIVASFLEEARVTSQLQHPGIVPIHEVGQTADGLAYFAMKVVEGETLGRLLKRRQGLHEDRQRFLRIFTQVCEAVAYAHHAGVVHRDLKPGNVMVGRFGEVQVLDWGFAASAGRGGTGAYVAEAASAAARANTAAVLGTPAYMAPEQARGDIGEIDTRTDVFALGATLVEILTGAPPYLADTREEVLLKAAKGWQQDVRQRLLECGADAALVALATRCLSPDKGQRPPDAAAVADAIAGHLAELEDRNRELHAQAAEARAHVKEERRRRRSTIATAIAVGIAVVAAMGYLLRSAASERAIEAAIARARVFIEQAEGGDPEDVTRWEAAEAAVEQAVTFARGAPGSHPAILELRERVGTGKEQARRDVAFLRWLDGPRLQLAYDLSGNSEGLDAGYIAALREWGVDVVATDVERAAATIRDSRIAIQVVHGLDRLVMFLADPMHGSSSKQESLRKMNAIAMAADGDPWRNRVRQALVDDDVETLKELSPEDRLAGASLASLDLLAGALRANGDLDGAVRVLRVAAQREPSEYQVVHSLQRALRRIGAPPREILWQSLRGVSLRPDSAHAWHHLADDLRANGEAELADQAYVRVAECGPDYPLSANLLAQQHGKQLIEQGYAVEARRLLAGLVEAQPGGDTALFLLALAEMNLHDTEAAVASLRAALAIRETAERRCNLGMALRLQGRFEESLAELTRGDELGRKRLDWSYPSGEWIELVKDLQTRAARLADSDHATLPAEPEERARFALVAGLIGRPRLALSLFREAFAGDPEFAEQGLHGPEHFDANYREFAVKAAVRVGTGGDGELANVSAAERLDALRQAQVWLVEEVDLLGRRALEQGSRADLRHLLSRLLGGPALAPVRDGERLRALGIDAAASERWQALWKRVQHELHGDTEPGVSPQPGAGEKR